MERRMKKIESDIEELKKQMEELDIDMWTSFVNMPGKSQDWPRL